MKFHHLDVSIGQRIRHARKLAGLSQTQLGEAIGISFQQIQKYESGKTRVSSSSLWEIAKRLDQPVVFFFPAFDENTDSVSEKVLQSSQTEKAVFPYSKKSSHRAKCD